MPAHHMTMGMHRCFEQGTVVADLASVDKFGALRELIRRAPVFRQIEGLGDFEESVIARERQQTTGLGRGVAVAHGRTRKVDRVLIGLGVSRLGIPYDAPDGMPVHLLFVIASPPEMSLDYLQTLSTLVRCLRDALVREDLLASFDAEEIERRIREAYTRAFQRCGGPLIGRRAGGAAG